MEGGCNHFTKTCSSFNHHFVFTVFPSPRLISGDPNTVNVSIAEVKIKGESFKSYEIFMQKGRGSASRPWKSLANVSAVNQIYVARKLDPNTRYAFTVCGRKREVDNSTCSKIRSIFTPPLGQLTTNSLKSMFYNRLILWEFLSWLRTINWFNTAFSVLSPPRNVKLEVQSKHDVFISWDPPAYLTMEMIKDQVYAISWSIDGDEQENIIVSRIQSYTFRNLSAGQLLTASVRFLSKDGKHNGPLSETRKISLPGGWSPSQLIAW